MKRFKSLLVALALGCTLIASSPVAAATVQNVMTICWYMGDVKNNYGGTGALWYCEMWDRTQLVATFTFVEPY
jgi:hypothetical protein